ncbi:hypothetical protein [Actinoalloteichus hymeniacidonis]|uniref:PE domain-containing protein n=1 Tax=Actinoalloteichus hymeniacidonis TaxID=340345 RepID=A0AAC9HV77_9PSEU|nr:hypothetical protein [Actinoalloteichus hymeniacidonis]AOS66172.1 hypothetical protein TL08_27020 [Actinoalloteichus hymeniacidonis]MBB5905725.1 hypothetical protein [Actinoalloteichus hymeniacidonis]
MTSTPTTGGGAVDIEVSEETVLGVRSVLLAEAERLRGGLIHLHRELNVEPMGGDPVSLEAAPIWTGRLAVDQDSYWQRCWDYMESLRQAGEELTQIALTYGYTEEEISNSFTPVRAGLDD